MNQSPNNQSTLARWQAALLDAWQHEQTRKRLWALAIPMILSNLSVPMVSLVDTAVIGRLPHAYQLGAVAVGASLYTLLVWVCGFLRMACTGFTAQAAGQNDYALLRLILWQSLILAVLLTCVLVASAIPLTDTALRLMKASPDLQATAREYFHIRLWGLPAALLMHVLAGWLLGVQNARAALWMLLAANLTNVVLDVYFVLGLHWEVAGAARASVVAEWLGAVTGLLLAARYLRAHFALTPWQRLLSWLQWRPLLAANRDILLRSLALQAVFFAVTVQGTRLGDSVVAANALLLNGLMLTAFALDGLAHALEALTGHALGARDGLALRRALWLTLLYSLLASLGFALLFLVFGKYFIALQTSMAEVRVVANVYVPYLALLPLITVWSYVLDGLFIGASKTKEMRNAMLLAVVLCAPAAWFLQALGNHGLWLAFLAFMLVRALCLLPATRQLLRAAA